MRRGKGTAIRTTLGPAIALTIAAAGGPLAAGPAQAGCTRSIVNKSGFTVVVSRDGGPGVPIPPHSAQPIHYYQPGRIAVALYCPTPYGVAPQAPVWQGSFGYSAIIDRCYIEVGTGFFEDQLGPGFGGIPSSKPLTLNMPRQGDFVVGPIVEERCAAVYGESVRARY